MSSVLRLVRVQKDTIPTIDTLTEISNPIKDYIAGNPYTLDKSITTAGTPEDVDVNTQLGRNAHKGFIRADPDNTGTMKVKFSYDGTNFTGAYVEFNAGESLSLDGMDIHTLRIDATVNGESLFIFAL